MCPVEDDSIDSGYLAVALVRLSWAQLDQLLETAGVEFFDDISESGKFAYLQRQLDALDQSDLVRVAAALEELDFEESVSESGILLFVSHSAKQRVLAGDLSRALDYLGVDAFVAHDSIDFDQEWREVIVGRLNSCDALLAIVSDDFASSTWCDQEVGWALGRKIPVMSINAGKSPYGFFGNRQALPYRDDTKDAARRVVERLLQTESTAAMMTRLLVRLLEGVGTYDGASEVIGLLSCAKYWDDGLLRRARRSICHNDQVTYADHGQAKIRLQSLLSQASTSSG